MRVEDSYDIIYVVELKMQVNRPTSSHWRLKLLFDGSRSPRILSDRIKQHLKSGVVLFIKYSKQYNPDLSTFLGQSKQFQLQDTYQGFFEREYRSETL